MYDLKKQRKCRLLFVFVSLKYPEEFMKRFIALILGLIMLTGTALPFSACAEEEEQKVVRVGWYESSFCSIDRFGRRCGIDSEPGGLSQGARNRPRGVPGSLSSFLPGRRRDGGTDRSALGLSGPCRKQPEGLGHPV